MSCCAAFPRTKAQTRYINFPPVSQEPKCTYTELPHPLYHMQTAPGNMQQKGVIKPASANTRKNDFRWRAQRQNSKSSLHLEKRETRDVPVGLA